MYLLSYRPPDNIAREVIDVQSRIYHRFGTPSSIAFPPVIPVKYYKKKISATDLPAEFQKRGADFSFDGFKEFKSALYLSVQTNFPVSPKKSSPISTFPGFLILALDEEKAGTHLPVDQFPPPPVMSWSSGFVELLSFRTNLLAGTAAEKPWWSEVYTEIIWSIRLLKGAKD